MKTIFVFALVVVSALAATPARRELPRDDKGNVIYPDYMFLADDNGKLHYVNLKAPRPKVDVVEDEVGIYIYTRQNPNNPDFMFATDLAALQASNWNPALRNVWVIHGWNNDHTSDVNTMVRTAALLAEDCNVFVVDWSAHSQTIDYPWAADATRGVGDWVGANVNLILAQGVPANRIILSGHSLGAHVAGRAGSQTTAQVNIVGMDPAGPLFSSDDFEGRIDQTDGDMVQIIHTNGGLLGFYDAMADCDIYPNGGDWQPGCGIDLVGTCAHSRAYEYYAESITSGGFTAVQCPSWQEFEAGLCSSNPQVRMGGLNLDMGGSGIHMLATNEEPPFSIGK